MWHVQVRGHSQPLPDGFSKLLSFKRGAGQDRDYSKRRQSELAPLPVLKGFREQKENVGGKGSGLIPSIRNCPWRGVLGVPARGLAVEGQGRACVLWCQSPPQP